MLLSTPHAHDDGAHRLPTVYTGQPLQPSPASAAAALKMGMGIPLSGQDFVSYTIDCIIEMASGNPFAALAENDDEVPNQASKKPQAVAGAAHQSAVRTSKDRQPAISERVLAKHPGGDKPSHSGAGPRRADRQSGEFFIIRSAWRNDICDVLVGGRTQRFGGSKSDVVKVSRTICFRCCAIQTNVSNFKPFSFSFP